MTLDEITGIDKELIAVRHEAAITEELARFLNTTIEAMLARGRVASRVISQMHEVAPEYDFEIELSDLIRRESGAALTYRRKLFRFFATTMSLILPNWIWMGSSCHLLLALQRQPRRLERGYDLDY
jgi:hypothetical protein